ncbi:MAG TPA: galactose oxidase early set domain-containing protein [Chloroflexota bacterium]
MGDRMRRVRLRQLHPSTFPLLTVAAILAGLLFLHACQETPEITQPSAATAAVSYRLTISGLGTGTGVVTSSPAGINCTITAGTAATTGCTAFFSQGVSVTLTAQPASGHSFVGWGNSCSGTGTCKVVMTTVRAVSAKFLKGPFVIKISSGTLGIGSGSVKSQTGLTPAIDCVITNGTPATTGCSATYPAYTALSLTATPATGFVFTGWGPPCSGTGICQHSVIRSRTIPATFSPAGSSTAATQGRWAPAFTTPVVAVHGHLLVTGKVLLWGDTGDAQLWDATNGFTAVPKTYRIYCSAHAFLSDGRLLVAGGTSPGTLGLRFATVFDPSSRSWSATSSMAQGRYYPTTTTLPNGEILAVSGHDTTKTVVTIPEIWNGNGWRRLTTASLAIPAPYYPAMFVAPNGKVFLAGFPQTTRYLDVTGTGQWTTVGNRNVADRTLGSAVMYAPGKILYAGGGKGPPYDAPPTASAEVIDLNQASPSWRTVPSMAFARRQTNATLLADGSVLVTGGTSGSGFNDQAGAVHFAELWNPRTETWTTMAAEAKNRTYHSIALLLPNGKVLSSGSGEGGGISYANSEFSAQVFSPPYLFNSDGSLAARPSITSAPSRLAYGHSFSVETPNAGSVTRGTLIRFSSVTHAFNQSQLIYPLAFAATSSTTVSAVAPANGNLAPPGPYMLFLINGSGVPSVAKMVTVGP